jgi:hypothetical protein
MRKMRYYAGIKPEERLKEYCEIAKSRGGECISTEYVNNHIKLKFRCYCGCEWESIGTNIKKGKWCPRCGGNEKYDIEDMKELAKKNGGECLSTEYHGIGFPLKWKCSEGHIWETRPNKILRGRWCHYCNQSCGENIVRCYLEAMIGYSFPKSRPKWLKNRNGHGLELDGFCKELNIAFEHNGDQHYKLTSYSKTEEKFKKIQNNDLDKRKRCQENNIKLLTIPQLFLSIKISDLKNIIKDFCNKNNIKIKEDIEIDLSKVYAPGWKKRTADLKKMAEELGGRLVSERYVNSKTKLDFCCNKGHKWKMLFRNLYYDKKWCPECKKGIK